MTKLYTYQCPNDRTVMTSPTLAAWGKAFRCNACQSGMRLLWAEEAVTEEQKALAARGPVYNPSVPQGPVIRKRPCATCRQPIEPGAEFERETAPGRFCSQACLDVGIREHDAFLVRVAEMKERMPWVK